MMEMQAGAPPARMTSRQARQRVVIIAASTLFIGALLGFPVLESGVLMRFSLEQLSIALSSVFGPAMGALAGLTATRGRSAVIRSLAAAALMGMLPTITILLQGDGFVALTGAFAVYGAFVAVPTLHLITTAVAVRGEPSFDGVDQVGAVALAFLVAVKIPETCFALMLGKTSIAMITALLALVAAAGSIALQLRRLARADRWARLDPATAAELPDAPTCSMAPELPGRHLLEIRLQGDGSATYRTAEGYRVVAVVPREPRLPDVRGDLWRSFGVLLAASFVAFVAFSVFRIGIST